MKKTWMYGVATLVVLGTLTTACSSKDEVIPSGVTGAKDAGIATVAQSKSDTSSKTVATAAKPAIDANYKVDGKNVTITYQTANFKLSEVDMNKANVQGEGHLHLYVDGKMKTMTGKTGPLVLQNLTPGTHEVKLELQQNDHKELNVEKILNITVK
ncbi:DUF6130 family protein [Paenibacillus roseipurpureus]|uniref:DUF6130 family protein n=1 Tax=Paenibacillus roseopurpureus TaxID=2918901 RepID=A0AA96LU74_9BACL|nr:DUF6130 family protein [Paenibacillus sp. MBLB1832]WNR44740.1 DUF6130 family protein [Paenibacillus sp. MBLB1832]